MITTTTTTDLARLTELAAWLPDCLTELADLASWLTDWQPADQPVTPAAAALLGWQLPADHKQPLPDCCPDLTRLLHWLPGQADLTCLLADAADLTRLADLADRLPDCRPAYWLTDDDDLPAGWVAGCLELLTDMATDYAADLTAADLTELAGCLYRLADWLPDLARLTDQPDC